MSWKVTSKVQNLTRLSCTKNIIIRYFKGFSLNTLIGIILHNIHITCIFLLYKVNTYFIYKLLLLNLT